MIDRTVSAKLALAGFLGAFALSSAASAADLSYDGGGGGYKDAPPAAYITDDSIAFRYGTAFKEPGVDCGACLPTSPGGDIEKGIIQFTHFNTDKWGNNFLNVDGLFSTNADPVASIYNNNHNNGTGGATEVYALYRRFFSYNGITNSNFSFGILKDVGLNIGGDFNTKDAAFLAEKRDFVVGPKAVFVFWGGHVGVAFDYYAEHNHNGFEGSAGAYQSFQTFESEVEWGFPINIGSTALTFQGFFNVVLPKGKQYCYLSGPTFSIVSDCDTKTEILTRPELMLDVGNYMGAPHKFEVGVGYEYWLNKFGNDSKEIPGALANTPELIARYHF
jgi:nucleoside-specific outer membrane channel protein Tsx